MKPKLIKMNLIQTVLNVNNENLKSYRIGSPWRKKSGRAIFLFKNKTSSKCETLQPPNEAESNLKASQ